METRLSNNASIVHYKNFESAFCIIHSGDENSMDVQLGNAVYKLRLPQPCQYTGGSLYVVGEGS